MFNTALLKEYFDIHGYKFAQAHFFEPRLNPKLAQYVDQVSKRRKRRRLLVYGRPRFQRNAFDLVVESLDTWAKRYGRANEWELISLGEKHHDITLANGLRLKSHGKVSLTGYANHLLDAAVGLSLMVSPHPSYPPLEMAEFGLKVVTNGFANKDLSRRSSNILSVSNAIPETIANAITECCENFDATGGKAHPARAFLGDENEFPFIDEITYCLLAKTH